MKYIITSFLILFTISLSFAQKFTKADELKGSITEERAWWDLQHYKLEIEVFPTKKEIEGTNTITYLVSEVEKVIQIDLQTPMKIDKVTQNGKKLKFKSKGNAHFIKLKEKQKIGDTNTLVIKFSGEPTEAANAPWDGGFSWKKDSNGNPFIATANQGIGASVWWPVKDHPADEPDTGVDMFYTVPSDLVAVGNGRLINEVDNGNTKTWHWKVTQPINSYGVNINIGDYTTFGYKHEGINGLLDVDYYVLKENLDKAKEQFSQVPLMLQAFEYWFGPYPFYEDSYKLVEVPYLGMEHQSSVTYGNNYQNGYLGNDLSGSGWGLRFDFIIIHESGHEWFANNITNKDVADMWIHEGFTAYSENLYLSYNFSDEAASEYVIGTRKRIQNDRPIIGTYNMDNEGSSDMYYKGANILHTVRQLLEDDKKWRDILRGLNKDFYHQTVTTQQVEEYISEKAGIDLTEFWEQYLRTTMIPKLEYKYSLNQLTYRYVDIIEGFDMPVIMNINGKEKWIQPNAQWQTFENIGDIRELSLKEDFFIKSQNVQ
ncbi:peptidase M1 [Patiriisocius marinistellae]|uniref:Peptidase M1 n=1 Tax=Patiriisocius marinistellae TaxID=2494560 RepID=A0A5J4FXQ1_9FLAO|nr:M1 family metallopeptidase [Patiriisocius marinistellae]GEQ85934.1 peptidase M1 [Patiriisocius marinistellae]